MRNLAVAIVLLLVGCFSYLAGRKHSAPPPPLEPIVPANSASAASTPQKFTHTASRPASADLPGNLPFSRNLTSVERGFEAARLNLDEALKAVESLPVSERMGFVTGIFSFVARNYTPAEALKIYQNSPEPLRPNALRALVAELIYSRSSLDEDMRYLKREGAFTISGSRQGLETELSQFLASAKPDAELTAAWLDAFSNHGSRAEIFSQLAGALPRDEAAAILARMDGWTPWERERVTRSFLSSWADQNPRQAWEWYQSQQGLDRDHDFSSEILAPWANENPDAVKNLLGSLTDPRQRQSVIDAIGKALATRNTSAAIEWANSLPEGEERVAAHRAVYEGAPRGIGAVLGMENGFPILRGIVPGGPLEGSGVQPGDQIIEVRQGNGATHPLFGRDLSTAVALIRGEPGSEVTLRILRPNRTSGVFQELLIPVQRGQLYLNQDAIRQGAPGEP